jgi:hypothetical protein
MKEAIGGATNSALLSATVQVCSNVAKMLRLRAMFNGTAQTVSNG